jgi:hypothetical protein
MSAPVERTELGSIALTVAAVPTGMKAGVLISPLAVVILPKRALPSLASKENFMLFSHKDIYISFRKIPLWAVYRKLVLLERLYCLL